MGVQSIASLRTIQDGSARSPVYSGIWNSRHLLGTYWTHHPKCFTPINSFKPFDKPTKLICICPALSDRDWSIWKSNQLRPPGCPAGVTPEPTLWSPPTLPTWVLLLRALQNQKARFSFSTRGSFYFAQLTMYTPGALWESFQYVYFCAEYSTPHCKDNDQLHLQSYSLKYLLQFYG